MDERHEFHLQLPTPFAQPSWEPRFAIDGPGLGLSLIRFGLQISAMLDLFPSNNSGDLFDCYEVSPTRLAVIAPKYGIPHPLSYSKLADQVVLDGAASAIKEWLDKIATYPTEPWFDGGGSKGFQMFYVPWAVGYESYAGFSGYVLIEPKWFEVHK